MSSKSSNFYETDPECIELMKFLIERTKDAKSPMIINQLAGDFKEKSGASQTVQCLVMRIQKLRERVADLDTIETATKVKLMFALSASIDEDYLNELRKDADLEVDGKNRIIKYRAHDERLELEGDQSLSAKNKEVWKKRKSGSQEDSGDSSQDSMPKTPGSVKRSAVEVPNSSKRAKVKSEDSTPDDSAGISPRGPPNPETQLLRQPKLEGDPEASITRSRGAPRASEANDAYTPQTKFFEAIQSLVLFLGIPSSEIHQKIHQKIQQKIQNIDGFTKIQNNEVTLTLELLVARTVNHSVPNLIENVESVSLKEFLCYLKAAILNSKLEGIEKLLEKIEEHIKEPESKDKNIPVEKVTRALQDTLNNVGF